MTLSVENHELFAEVEPESEFRLGNECYVLQEEDRPGLNGFFLLIKPISLPFFFEGGRETYKFFKSSANPDRIVVWRRNRFVCCLWANEKKLFFEPGPFDSFENRDRLKFFNDSYPIPLENPDLVFIDPISGILSFGDDSIQVKQPRPFVQRSFG